MGKKKVSFKELLGLDGENKIGMKRNESTIEEGNTIKPFDSRAPIISEKSDERNIREGVQPVIEPQGDVRHLRAVENQSSKDSRPIIDFSDLDWSYLSDNSSFQRGVMEFIKKIVPGLENIEVRGSKDAMAKSFSQEKRNFINVMSEFKSKLEKIKNE